MTKITSIRDMTDEERDALVGQTVTEVRGYDWLDYYPVSHDGDAIIAIVDVDDPRLERCAIVNDSYARPLAEDEADDGDAWEEDGSAHIRLNDGRVIVW